MRNNGALWHLLNKISSSACAERKQNLTYFCRISMGWRGYKKDNTILKDSAARFLTSVFHQSVSPI
jgi:hypothetical protein